MKQTMKQTSVDGRGGESNEPPTQKPSILKRALFAAADVLAVITLVLAGMAWTIWSYGYDNSRNADGVLGDAVAGAPGNTLIGAPADAPWNVRADAAIVLDAAAWNCKPSPVLREPIEESIQLYRAGMVEALIFTGGIGTGDRCSDAEASREYALQQGIPPHKILLESKSRITEENLRNAMEVAQRSGFSRFYVVSDPLHMKWAMCVAENLEMDARPAPTSTSAHRSLRTKLPFLARETFYWAAYEISRFLPKQLR
ncbi:YdcF family protein [Paenibacillus herberti]|nr:YdcF family protein [Paenibacillus herberti]